MESGESVRADREISLLNLNDLLGIILMRIELRARELLMVVSVESWVLDWRERGMIREFFDFPFFSRSFLSSFRMTTADVVVRRRSRRTHDQHSHQSQSSTERNIPAELERSTGHHSAQHRAAGEGATYGGVGGIMGAGLEREGDDS